MTLITSISGIRGTIGGFQGENLTPPDLVRFTSAYSQWIRSRTAGKKSLVVVGRDGRISGPMVERIVTGTLMGMGMDVICLGLASTPSVEMAVPHYGADGGMIFTASHNPEEWNALKLLNHRGEFITEEEGRAILEMSEKMSMEYSPAARLGTLRMEESFDEVHIGKILALDLVDTQAIQKASLTVVVDGINSVGGLVIPRLLRALGVKKVVCLNCTPDGLFAHNPEPLPEHLSELCKMVQEENADLGIVVDPDADRLAFVDENGKFFGEEYTLVAVADYILRHTPGSTVSNLSSSRALKDLTEKYGEKYTAAAVGEVNVVQKMRQIHAVIGGEGNGGVIYPALHYGRDALVGTALFLSFLAGSGKTCSAIREGYPDYYMVKEKIRITEVPDTGLLLKKMEDLYHGRPLNREDGLKIEFDQGWVHLRKSNTEPIIRIYSEAGDLLLAEKWVREIKEQLKKLTAE